MPQLTGEQVAKLARDAGLSGAGLETAVAIAYRESRFNSDAVGDKDNPKKGCGSFGLWQINSCPGYGAGPPRYEDNPSALLDPVTNARAMAQLSQNGTNFQPWLTYRKGVDEDTISGYRQMARDAIAGIGGGGGPSVPLSAGGTSSPTDAGGVSGAVSTITDGGTWLRIATFLGGAGVLLLAVYMFTGATAVKVAGVDELVR